MPKPKEFQIIKNHNGYNVKDFKELAAYISQSCEEIVEAEPAQSLKSNLKFRVIVERVYDNEALKDKIIRELNTWIYPAIHRHIVKEGDLTATLENVKEMLKRRFGFCEAVFNPFTGKEVMQPKSARRSNEKELIEFKNKLLEFAVEFDIDMGEFVRKND